MATPQALTEKAAAQADYGWYWPRCRRPGCQDRRHGPGRSGLKARSDEALASIIELTGAPGLDDYRKVSAALKLPWPGDEQIRQRYPVAM